MFPFWQIFHNKTVREWLLNLPLIEWKWEQVSRGRSSVLAPIKHKGLMSDAILLAKLEEKRLELTASDEKGTLNIFNESKVY